MADESAPRQTPRFRRLDPISPDTSPSRRNSRRRITSQRDQDGGSVTEGDTGRDSVDHQQHNDSPAGAAANTMDPATPQPDSKRRKVKRKRFLSLGRDGLNNYKRKKTAEEKEILEALDADTDHEDDVPVYDCIKVAGARLRPPTGMPEPADGEKGKTKITMGVRKAGPATSRRKGSAKATPVGKMKEMEKKTVQTKLFDTAKRSTEDLEDFDSLRGELSEHPDLDIGETELLSRTSAQADSAKADDPPKEKTPATEEAGPEPAKSDEPVHDDQITPPPLTDRMEIDVPEPEEVHQPLIEASNEADGQLRAEQAQTGEVEKGIPEPPMINEDHEMSGTAPSAKPTNEEPVISAPRELTPEPAPPPKDERQAKLEQLVFVIFKFPNTTSQYQITGADIIDTTTKDLSWTKLQLLLEEKWGLDFSRQGLLMNWEYRIKGQEQLNKCTTELLEHGRPGHEMVLLDFVRGKHLEDEAREVLDQLQRIRPDHPKGLATVPANLPDAKDIKRLPLLSLDSSTKRRTRAIVPGVRKETDANPRAAQDTASSDTVVLKREEEVEAPGVLERPRAVSSHSRGDSSPAAKRQAVDPSRRTSLLVSSSNVWSSGNPTSDRWNRRSTPTSLVLSTSRWKREWSTGQTTAVRRASPLLIRAGPVKSSPGPVAKPAAKTTPGPSGEVGGLVGTSKQQSKLPFRPTDLKPILKDSSKDSPKENPVVTDKVDVPEFTRKLALVQANDLAKKLPSSRPVGTPVKSTEPQINGSPLDGLKAARGAFAASPLRPSIDGAFRAVTRPEAISRVEEASTPEKEKDKEFDTAIQPPAPSPMQIDTPTLAIEKRSPPKPSPKPASANSNGKRPRTDDSAVPEESVAKIVDYKGPTDYKVVYSPPLAIRGLGPGLAATMEVSSPSAKVATPEASVLEAQSAGSLYSTEEESEREKEEIAEQADRLLALASGLFDKAPAGKAAAPKKPAARKRATKSKESPVRRSLIVKLPLPKGSSPLKTVEHALPATPATATTPSVNSATSQQRSTTKTPPSTTMRTPSFTPVNIAGPRPIIAKPLPPPQTLPAKPQPYRRPDRLDTGITPAQGFRAVNIPRPGSASAATTTPRPNVSLPRPPAFGIPRPNSTPGSNNKIGTISAAVSTPTASKHSTSTPATTKSTITPLVPRDNFLYWDGQTSPPAATSPATAPSGWALPTLERTITAAPLTGNPSTAAFTTTTTATPASPHLLPPSSIRFSISRLHTQHTKILISGHEIAKFSNPSVLDWEKLAEIARGNLKYNDYHESMIVNMQFLVEDQETLERWMGKYGTMNEVLVCEVDDLGRPTDRGLVEGMKRRRREERERLEEV